MSPTQVDLAVIGSGSAAFAAAIRASALGKSVAMIERSTIGGTCVNVGCVPSKALLAAADARHVALDSRFAGITTSAGQVDMHALVADKRALVDGLRSEKYVDIAADHGWQLVAGTATFTGSPDAPLLSVTAQDGSVVTVQADHYLVATGSRPSTPDIDGLEEVDFLTSTTAMELEEVPGSLLVLGGGYVAMEQAQLFARLGTQVTMLVRSRLASREEPEASESLMQVFADEGIRVVLRAGIDSVGTDPDTGRVVAVVTLPGGPQEFTADKLLAALGRTPNVEELNLDAVQVKTDERGHILVSDQLATSNPRIWAAGDVTGHHEFVYVAAAHGAMVADNADRKSVV